MHRDVFVDRVDMCPNRPVMVSAGGVLIDVAAVRFDNNRQVIVIALPDDCRAPADPLQPDHAEDRPDRRP